jgi:hypothetical protein
VFSTSDVEPEIDDSLQFKNNQSEIHDALVKSLSELQSPDFQKRPSLTDSVEKTPTIKNLFVFSLLFPSLNIHQTFSGILIHLHLNMKQLILQVVQFKLQEL